jgi:hypothetical protein
MNDITTASSNEIDEALRRVSDDPFAASPRDIDLVIEHQRRARANLEAGVRPKKLQGPTAPLMDIVTSIAKAEGVVKPAGIPRRKL